MEWEGRFLDFRFLVFGHEEQNTCSLRRHNAVSNILALRLRPAREGHVWDRWYDQGPMPWPERKMSDHAPRLRKGEPYMGRDYRSSLDSAKCHTFDCIATV